MIQYFDGCPSWQLMEQRVREAMTALDIDPDGLELKEIRSTAQAEVDRFHGSPSLLVNGIDAFASADAMVGMACRLYRVPSGLSGTPTRDEILSAIAAAVRSATLGA